jgi:DNA repair protein RecO (recombination protein O)
MTRTAASAPYLTRAVVLRARSLGEKDRVVTLLSPNYGKFAAVARGARGAKSKLAAASQPFTLARFLLARGRSLDIVTQAQIENAHTHIAADLLKTAWASYLCELCDAVPEQLPDEALFDLFCAALAALDAAPEVPDTSLAVEVIGYWFEAQFLTLLGYAPMLGRCVACGEKITVPLEDATRQLAFSPALGGTLCRLCASRDPQRLNVLVQALRLLRQLERASAPPDPNQLFLTSGVRRDLRSCLRRCLVLHLDVKLKSQNFLDDVMAAQTLHTNDV